MMIHNACRSWLESQTHCTRPIHPAGRKDGVPNACEVCRDAKVSLTFASPNENIVGQVLPWKRQLSKSYVGFHWIPRNRNDLLKIDDNRTSPLSNAAWHKIHKASTQGKLHDVVGLLHRIGKDAANGRNVLMIPKPAVILLWNLCKRNDNDIERHLHWPCSWDSKCSHLQRMCAWQCQWSGSHSPTKPKLGSLEECSSLSTCSLASRILSHMRETEHSEHPSPNSPTTIATITLLFYTILLIWETGVRNLTGEVHFRAPVLPTCYPRLGNSHPQWWSDHFADVLHTRGRGQLKSRHADNLSLGRFQC